MILLNRFGKKEKQTVLAKTHKIKSIAAERMKGRINIDPLAMRANIRYGFMGGWKVGWCGFMAGLMTLLAPLALYFIAYSVGTNFGLKRTGVEQFLANSLVSLRLDPLPLELKGVVYLNMGGLLLLLGLMGLVAAFIKRAIIRRRPNRAFVSSRPRIWLEAAPFVVFAFVAGMLQRRFAALYAAEAVILFVLWSFWYAILLGTKKKAY